MTYSQVKLPKSGFFPILFWVLKREPWRIFNLILGLAVSLLNALVFIAISNHFPEAVRTIHIPPSTFFDWLFLSSVALVMLGSMDLLLIYCLSLRLAWNFFLSMLIRVALFLAVEFILWPVRSFFAWIGQGGPLHGIIQFLTALFTYSTFPPVSVWESVRDIIAGVLYLVFIGMIVVGYVVSPDAEEPNLELGLFVPILVRKYKKAKAANKLTLADEYLRKAHELYNGAIQEARQKADEDGQELVISTFEDALGL